MKRFLTASALLATLTSSLAFAALPADESAIRTSDRSGGSIYTLTLQRTGTSYFSVTGRWDDTLVIYGQGRIFMWGTLDALADVVPLDRPPVRLPDGRVRLFFREQAPGYLNGGTAVLFTRNGTLVDSDAITVR